MYKILFTVTGKLKYDKEKCETNLYGEMEREKNKIRSAFEKIGYDWKEQGLKYEIKFVEEK